MKRRRPPRRIRGIIYLPEYREKNWRKHRVSEEEVIELLAGSVLFRFQQKGLRRGEDLYTAWGQTRAGRFLIVFFIHKTGGEALILSARDMTTAERRNYEKHKTRRV